MDVIWIKKDKYDPLFVPAPQLYSLLDFSTSSPVIKTLR